MDVVVELVGDHTEFCEAQGPWDLPCLVILVSPVPDKLVQPTESRVQKLSPQKITIVTYTWTFPPCRPTTKMKTNMRHNIFLINILAYEHF